METVISSLTIVSLVLGIVSATLAVAAFIFSWVSFCNTTRMQMNAEAILAKISEKVEVVVERTSHQIDRAWDYFTRPTSESASKDLEELVKREEVLREKLLEEVRREVTQTVEKAGLSRKELESLVARVESVVGRSAERTVTHAAELNLLTKVLEVEKMAREFAAVKGHAEATDASLSVLAELLKDYIHPQAKTDLDRLGQIRSQIGHEELDNKTIEEGIRLANRLARHLEHRAKKAIGG